MNIHHLELFYYVARYGGISAAIRRMPYGIQQPAVSGQLLALEAHLGAKLFHRRPFALTPAGERLFRFVQPFFQNLDVVEDELRGRASARLRLAASTSILRDYGPQLLERLRRQVPDLRLVLREADQTIAEALLAAQEVDLAITELYTKPPAGVRSDTLVEAPLALLTPNSLKSRDLDLILEERPLPLISVPAQTAIHKAFQDGLRKRGLTWDIGIELSTLEMVATYVAAGFGIGLVPLVPGLGSVDATRLLPLPDFPRLRIAAFWQEPLPPLAKAFLDGVRGMAGPVQAQIAQFWSPD